jgi:Ca-activated chloride channel family protein
VHPALRLTVAGFALVVALAGGRDLRAQVQPPAFHVGVDLVSLNVTVSNGNRLYVTDLDRDDFVVLEDGVPQELRFFARTGVPLAVGLLIDASASMRQMLASVQTAAIGFVRQIGPMDLATMIGFDDRVQTAQGLTSDQQALETAIRQTASGGSTALYNAVYITLKEMAKLPRDDRQNRRRRAIIVLSDGDDTASLVSFDTVLELAANSGTAIYTIGLWPRHRVALQDTQYAEFVLRRLAEQTGGRAFFPQHIKGLAAAYGDIRQELANQYSLAYQSSSSRRAGEWRGITVRVNRPDVMVRTKKGYFGSTK